MLYGEKATLENWGKNVYRQIKTTADDNGVVVADTVKSRFKGMFKNLVDRLKAQNVRGAAATMLAEQAAEVHQLVHPNSPIAARDPSIIASETGRRRLSSSANVLW